MKNPDDLVPLWRTAKAGSALERSLSAARHRAPTSDQLRELERNVAIAVGAGTMAAVVAAATIEGEAAAPGAVATAGLSATKVAVVLLATATVCGTAAVLFWQSGPPAARAPFRPSPSSQASHVSPAHAEQAPAQVEQPASRAAGESAASPPRAAPAALRARASRHPAPGTTPRPVARTNSAAGATTLPTDDVDELQLLSRARRALVTDPAGALALADEHRRRFTRGSMDQEGEVIAVEALVGLGRLADARRRAQRFADEHAGSVYVGRIQHILSRGSSPQ